MEKYQQYIDAHWWSNVEKIDLANWERNFGKKEYLAKIVLDKVIFYNSGQLKSYAKFMISKLQERVYINAVKENGYKYVDDSILFEKWKEYLKHTIFCPAAGINDAACSAHRVLSIWRGALEKGSAPCSSFMAIPQKYEEGVRRFIFVDDFSGSGKQMSDFLSEKVQFKDKQIELGMIPSEFDDIEIIIAVFVIHEKAKELLEKKFKDIKILYVDLIDDDFNYLNENARMYGEMDSEKRRTIVAELRELNETVSKSKRELSELSAYVLNIPIVFEHGCPNNTLLLLFANSEGIQWNQLFKRGKEL